MIQILEVAIALFLNVHDSRQTFRSSLVAFIPLGSTTCDPQFWARWLLLASYFLYFVDIRTMTIPLMLKEQKISNLAAMYQWDYGDANPTGYFLFSVGLLALNVQDF